MAEAAAGRGLDARLALASTATAARLLARVGTPGTVRLATAGLDTTLAPLPIGLLASLGEGEEAEALQTACRQWGLRTVGEFAALPARGVAARLGRAGALWQRLARGEDLRPLRPATPEERFEHALDLDWPVEGLEPLAFALGRALEPVAAMLARRGRGAAELHVRLHLVTRAVHVRALTLPAPIHDARTLRTLALLDLESHPPPAAVDRVAVRVEPMPARVVQFSLFTRAHASPETLSTLLARLQALMGGDRCGAPVPEGSWRPGGFAQARFAPAASAREPSHVEIRDGTAAPAAAVRRYRFPVPARVRLDAGRPMRVTTDRHGLPGGRVDACAGPWRTSGGWWNAEPPAFLPPPISPALPTVWDRDEWDVALAGGPVWRIFRDHGTGAWFVEGEVD
jgi:protein ImuB